MKDFDEARRQREVKDRSFRIGGEEFVYRAAVAPETILEWSAFASFEDKEKAVLAAAQAALGAAVAKNEEATRATPPRAVEFSEAHVAELQSRVAAAQASLEAKARTDQEWLAALDAVVSAVIEPDYEEAWRSVRSPELAHPLSIGDLNDLVEWLVPEVVGRPTEQPSGSSPSDGSTGTSSTGASSSPAEPESPPST